MLFWAQSVNAQVNGYWWWYIPPGLAVALLGTALALLNFGIDEFINPRLRAAGLTRKRARQAGIPARFPLGVTPVVRPPGDTPAARPPASTLASRLPADTTASRLPADPGQVGTP
jgi:peptide/nickel transport system permease protein